MSTAQRPKSSDRISIAMVARRSRWAVGLVFASLFFLPRYFVVHDEIPIFVIVLIVFLARKWIQYIFSDPEIQNLMSFVNGWFAFSRRRVEKFVRDDEKKTHTHT
jgi:hypothetical protein